jgi:hypothetical protein
MAPCSNKKSDRVSEQRELQVKAPPELVMYPDPPISTVENEVLGRLFRI